MGSFGSFSKSQESSAEQKQHPEVLLLEEEVFESSVTFSATWGFLSGIPIHMLLQALLKKCSACPGVNLSIATGRALLLQQLLSPARATEGGGG